MGVVVAMGEFKSLFSGKDTSNPAMTLENNPLAKVRDPKAMVRERNEDRLLQDAKMRECPWNGHVYAGMMDTRYRGG